MVKKVDYTLIGLIALAGVVIIFWKKIYEMFLAPNVQEQIQRPFDNLGKDQANELAQAIQEGLEAEWFSPLYWKKQTNAKVFTVASSAPMVQTIHSALSGIGTDESALFSVFQGCKYRTQVSWLADIYQKTFGHSMLADITDDLNDDELGSLFNLVKRLPVK